MATERDIKNWMFSNLVYESGELCATKLAENACQHFDECSEDGQVPELYFEYAADVCNEIDDEDKRNAVCCINCGGTYNKNTGKIEHHPVC